MTWDEAMRRISAGEDVTAVLDEMEIHRRTEFVKWLRLNVGNEAADRHMSEVRDIDTGVYSARNCWHSISPAQRRALATASEHGGRLERIGKEYRHRDIHQPYRAIYVATIRALCAHNLMAWDGGAFDPEGAAVVTERGRFVLTHGGQP